MAILKGKWMFNELTSDTWSGFYDVTVNFSSNGEQFIGMRDGGQPIEYVRPDGSTVGALMAVTNWYWVDEAYRIVYFGETEQLVDDAFYDWFVDNAVDLGLKGDTFWYNDTDTEFILYDKYELKGFSTLSQTNNFAGKIIKLGADITLNKGDAADWATAAPANIWTPIGTNSNKFAGTFDGQNHTISGLYLKSTGAGAAMFSEINDATIRNFNLVNSYIETTHNSQYSYTGGIAAYATGTSVTFENVTCDAIVKSAGQRVGGFVGRTDTIVNITDCAFSGDITGNNDTAGFIGFLNVGKAQNLTRCAFTGTVAGLGTNAAGLIGNLKNDSAAIATITDCLVAGTISGSGTNYGGLVAMGAYSAKIVAKNCLVVTDMRGATSATSGSVVGNNPGGGKSTYTNVYATIDSHTNLKGAGSANFTVTSVVRTDIIGYNAKINAPNLDYVNTWAAIRNDTPQLKQFQKGKDALPVYDNRIVKYPIKTETIENIVNTLRECLGQEDSNFKYALADIPDAIKQVQESFWDKIQNKGERRHYGYAFAFNAWNESVLKPKYVIHVQPPIDNSGDSYSGYYIFYNNTTLINIEQDIIISNCEIQGLFGRCSNLKSVKSITLNGVSKISLCFNGATNLEHIIFKGSIETSMNISACSKLDDESINSIFACLSTDVSEKTITFSKQLKEKIEGIEGIENIETNSYIYKNWSIKLA